MIVRADQQLSDAILGTPEDGPIAEASCWSVWDGQGLTRIPSNHKEDQSYLKDIAPEWLVEMLVEGSTLFLSPEDYASLDYEIQKHMDIIRY